MVRPITRMGLVGTGIMDVAIAQIAAQAVYRCAIPSPPVHADPRAPAPSSFIES